MKKFLSLKFALGLAIVLSVTFAASQAWAPQFCWRVTKTCTSGDPIQYTITVDSCGYTTLWITVIDSMMGTVHEGWLDDWGSFTLGNIEYSPQVCGDDVTNTVNVIARTSPTGDPVSNNIAEGGRSEDSATCSTPCGEPCIDVTKNCTDAEDGEPIEYTGIVHNCGDVELLVTLDDLTFGKTIFEDQPLAAGASTSYSFTHLPESCGDDVPNTVEAVGAYGSTTVSAQASAACMMKCEEGGCTLTPGYWKTHSKYGPAPYDDTWAIIGEDTLFFSSGQSYYQVLWTNPRGNAYYILAHAYIAAELNGENGASMGVIQDAFDEAKGLFETYKPGDIAGLKGKDPVRRPFVELAGILDVYNNGFIGPGHCPD